MDKSQDIPTLDDLTPWARRAFDCAYKTAVTTGLRRERCNTDDFAAGYLAALMELRSWSSFSDEARGRIPGATPAPAPRSAHS